MEGQAVDQVVEKAAAAVAGFVEGVGTPPAAPVDQEAAAPVVTKTEAAPESTPPKSKDQPPLKAGQVAGIEPSDAPEDTPKWLPRRLEQAKRSELEKIAKEQGFDSHDEMVKYLAETKKERERAVTEKERMAKAQKELEERARQHEEQAKRLAAELDKTRKEHTRAMVDARLRSAAEKAGITDPDAQEIAIKKYVDHCRAVAKDEPNKDVSEKEFFSVDLKAKSPKLYDVPVAAAATTKAAPTPATTGHNPQVKPAAIGSEGPKNAMDMSDDEFKKYVREKHGVTV